MAPGMRWGCAPTVGLQTAGRAPDAPASQSRGNNRVTTRRARLSHYCSGARWRSMWKGTSFRWACLGYRQCNLCEITFTKCRSRFCCVLLSCCKFELAPWGHRPANVNQTILNDLDMPLPSIEEQREIVRCIERTFNWITRLASEATNARRLIDHLDQAILAKAFRGELVPQEPNDELCF
jgi:hypothetical protein